MVMRLLSGFLGFLILLLAVVFALSNRQSATLVFWPFGFDLSAPLCLFLLAALLGGSLLGAGFAMCSMLPVYWESRHMRRELARQRQRIEELESERRNSEGADREQLLPGLPGRSAERNISRNNLFSWGPR